MHLAWFTLLAALVAAAASTSATPFVSLSAAQPPAPSSSLAPQPTPRPSPSTPLPFFFGTATAAYQVEGAVDTGGRGPTIWDTFSHTPGRTARGDTGDEADDFFHRFPADLLTASALGASAFRFSIAWTRLFPDGNATGVKPNAAGVAFYHSLLDACEGAGLEPWVTLYHWDLPLALQTSYGGWASPRIVGDFASYAGAVFREFGGRVRSWVREMREGVRSRAHCGHPPFRLTSSPPLPTLLFLLQTTLNGKSVWCSCVGVRAARPRPCRPSRKTDTPLSPSIHPSPSISHSPFSPFSFLSIQSPGPSACRATATASTRRG